MKSRKWSGGQKNKGHHRKKYVDQSKTQDWAHRLGLDKTAFGRELLRLEKVYHLRNVFFSFLFCFLLSLLMFSNFEIPSNFTEGVVANTTLKSPISFEMVDEMATNEKRAEAEKSVPSVFDYDVDLLDRLSAGVFDSFQEMRLLMSQESWPEKWKNESTKAKYVKEFAKYKEEFENKLGASVSNRIFSWLAGKRFDPDIENLVIRAHETWLENKIIDDSFKEIGTVTLRRIPSRSAKQDESAFEMKDFVDLSKKSVFRINKVPGVEGFRASSLRHIEKFAYVLMRPNVTLNLEETAERRRKARESVLPIVVSVKKGQVLISEGSVVQPVHLRLLAKLSELQANRSQDLQSLVGALLLMTFVLVSFSYLKRFSLHRVLAANKDIVFMGLVIALIVLFTKSFLFMTNAAFTQKLSDFIYPATFLFAAPVLAGPMIVGLVITSGELVWLFTIFLASVLGLMVEQNFAFAVICFVSGMAAVRGVQGCSKRNDIYWAGVRAGLVSALLVFLFMTLMHSNQEDYWNIILWTVPAAFLSGILSSMLTMIAIPILESTFNYTTDIRLLELSNLNHPLLKEMLIRAPGTYHHSMMVGSLVEAAAEQIRANPLLSKVMAYYHDIGKIEHAEYFIENQRKDHNPHDHISPYMSKTILIAHVKDGAELGLKHNLGKPIIDGILQHHGTGLISYFYNKAIQQADEHSAPAEDEFRYPGPKPQFREAALVMLADGIEAAARSLDEPTPIRLQNIVRNIIQRRFMEGQLDECNLTLRDLSRCELAFNRILLGIYHQRIDYPKEMGGGTSEEPDSTLRMMN